MLATLGELQVMQVITLMQAMKEKGKRGRAAGDASNYLDAGNEGEGEEEDDQ